MSVRERRIETRDGVRLRVEDRNQEAPGTPLLLLHGFTGSVEAWGEALLRRLADQRRVVAVDLPGHGGSDAPEEPERYRLARVLDDLEELLSELTVPRAVWVGYSMGGRVALGAAVLRPARVAALVLESTTPGLAEPLERRARRMADEALARRIETGGPRGMEAFVDDWMELPLFASQRRLPPHVLEAERFRRMGGSPVGLAGTLRGLGTGRQPSFWSELERVEVPALVLTGSLDGKYEGIGDAMASALPGAVRRSVEGAGHTVHLERPDRWLDEVRSFLTTLEEAGR